jgi:hypothetical protein
LRYVAVVGAPEGSMPAKALLIWICESKAPQELSLSYSLRDM